MNGAVGSAAKVNVTVVPVPDAPVIIKSGKALSNSVRSSFPMFFGVLGGTFKLIELITSILKLDREVGKENGPLLFFM